MRTELEKLQLPLPIAIIGLGVSGDSVLRLLQVAGVPRSQILTFDQKSPADFQDPNLLMSTGRPATLCVSPGVPLKTEWIQKALSSGLRLTSEMEIAFSFMTTETVIAITGAVGKSTTTSILGAGAFAQDPDAFVGGNLGLPLADYATGLLQGTRKQASIAVLELSSYQLENFRNLKCQVGVLTHLSANHMERYRDLKHYYETKMSLFRYATKFGVLNRSGGDIANLIQQIQKENPKLRWSWTDRNDPWFQSALKAKPRLVGSHNMDNLAVAFQVAKDLSWPESSFKAMTEFPGLAHRLENCGSVDGVLFLNDSKSTTIESVLQALNSVIADSPKHPIHLLVGGKDKNLPWENLSAATKNSQVKFYFFGEVGGLAQKKSGIQGTVYPGFGDALHALKDQVHKGDIVLLSPGGTSWDEFKNFEERGNYFKNWVLTEFQSHKR